MKKIWNKGFDINQKVEGFTVGKDRELDIQLAKYDVIGSMAHIKMLVSIGLLEKEEEKQLQKELRNIITEVEKGNFQLNENVEDIHSQVEAMLIERLGEMGKKIHSGRSRNDQILLDIKLFLKDEIQQIAQEVFTLFETLQTLSETYKNVLLPGYTHGQIAMPSSFGLWLGAYAETLVDDMHTLASAYRVTNQNPLGSAAGYGSSFPLDREMTTRELEFETMNYNVISAQMGSKELTTGSSIMPHKKNPDVWELIRAYSNRLQSLPNEISLMTTNMPHGYHRDYQLLKEVLFPAIDTLKNILEMSDFMLQHIQVNDNILSDSKYDYLFTVEEVNKRVLQGVPFREAYQQVGKEVENGTYQSEKTVHHTHAGSIGNLCTQQIKEKMVKVMNKITRVV